MLENCGLNIQTEENHINQYLPEFYNKKYTSNKSFNFNADPNTIISNKIAKKALVNSSLSKNSPPINRKKMGGYPIKLVNSKNGQERNNKLINNQNYSSKIL